MSYDLYAYRFRPDVSPKQLQKMLKKGDPDEHSERLSREAMEGLADSLMAVDASADRHDAAEFIEIESEAMQVRVDASGAEITIPYHGLSDEGNTAMDRAFEYAEVMAAAGLTVWDPQTELIVGDEEDHDKTSTTRQFGATSEVAREMAEDDELATEDEPSEASPRWKFWRR